MTTATAEKKKRAKQGDFICPNCKKVFDFQGSLNIHKYHCDNKMMRQGAPGGQKEEKCEHVFRALDMRNPLEFRARQGGYDEVCKKCQEVR